MIKTYILTIVCILLCLPSCYRKREHKYHFTQRDSMYFNAYDTAKPYFFKTNKGFDVLYLTNKGVENIKFYPRWGNPVIYETDRRGIFTGDDTIDTHVNFFYYGNFIHNNVAKQFSIWLTKYEADSDPIITFRMGERCAYDIKDSRNLEKHGKYKDVIIIDDENSEIQGEKEVYIFEQIKWNKYQGIVGYELSDGTVFNKTTHK